MSVDIEATVRKYIELRDACEKIDKEAKERKAPLAAAMDTIEAVLMKIANEQGVTSFKTLAGTAFVTTVSRCGVSNWDETLQFIRDNDAFNLLNKAVNKTAVQEYIDAHETPPPGVSWTVMREVQVRRS